jgi:hypothetical protein
MGEMLLDVVSE